MAEAVVSVALETLGNLLIQEARFLRGVRDQVEELQTEFGRMQSLLKDADRKQNDRETIRNWIKDIRRLAYRAEDVLEEYVVKVASGKGGRFTNILKISVRFANETSTLHKLGSEIESIKSNITILTGHMNQSGIQALITRDQEETSNENRRLFIRKTYPHEELEHFVGMDKDIEKLVSLLVSDQESRHRVIGVWGMGGSGKTTVSNKVYKHMAVKRFFDSFAWVCITQKCQIQSVIEEIFQQLLNEFDCSSAERKKDTNDIKELVEKIYKVQMEKKCLIVVDDIWKLDDWKCLSKCFPNVGSHSKVLLTTRNKNVAEIGYPIELKGLTEDEAWQLLRMKAFAKIDFQEPRDHSEYENLGRKMIRKCDCLPLAVAVIGGIMSSKNSLREWKLASEDVNSYIGRGEGTGVQGEVEKVLALSYDELPYHLKPCFLSLGFLREDGRTSVAGIYDLWMAEGLIQSKHVRSRESMRDVAELYLYELQFRSMVQFDDISMTLSLHDSILDFCISKAKEEEFLKVVDKCVDNCNISVKASRLVVHMACEDIDLDVFKAIENITPLRSVQIFRKDLNNLINVPKKLFNLQQFKSLRILVVVSSDLIGKCFHGIENLIHLRLLGLIRCEWKRFSLESVNKLSFLQTLDLTGTKLSLMKLPRVDTFCKMRQLRHLYLPFIPDDVRIEGKLRLMNLSQLETLYYFQSKFYDVKDLDHLQKLRTLRWCRVNNDENLVQITDYICGSNLRWIDISIENCNLEESDALRKLLKISNVTLQLWIYSCKLLKVPRLKIVDFSQMCPGLVDLILRYTDIAEDIMQALGKFPNLKKLWLGYIQFGGEEMVCDAGSFPRLEELFFLDVKGTFELRIDEAALPNLSSMKIALCFGINFMIPKRLRLFVETDRTNYYMIPGTLRFVS